MTVSVCLVDDQTLVRQGIRSLLELSDDIRVVAEAVDGAQAAIDAAVRGQRAIEAIADHRRTLRAREVSGEQRERRGAVVVVGIDDRERPVECGAAAPQRMAGAERLAPAGRRRATVRNGLHGLLDEDEFRAAVDMRRQPVRERFAQLRADHQHDAREAGHERVVDCVLDQPLAVGTERGELLVAAEAVADAGGQHDQDRTARVHGAAAFGRTVAMLRGSCRVAVRNG